MSHASVHVIIAMCDVCVINVAAGDDGDELAVVAMMMMMMMMGRGRRATATVLEIQTAVSC